MPDFFATHPLYESGTPDPDLDTYAGMPDELRQRLKQVGTSSYANGLFRFVAPAEFRSYLSFFNLDPAECLPFLKGAFGHLVFLHGEQYKLLDPIVNSIDDLGEPLDLRFAMNMLLSDRDILESTFLIDVYEAAFPRLGAPAADEMYAFVPAIGLGGSREAENVQKRSMAAEMQLLSQL
jgi:hypothetical protein